MDRLKTINHMKIFYLALFLTISANLFGQVKVALLGTGTPNPDPEHSGCSIAICVGDQSYIVDFGPGLVRQAAALSPRYGGKIKALDAKNLTTAFLTHLHSDHTTGYPDLILTPWVMGRNKPLEVYGPEGTKRMTTHILEAYREDISYRLYGTEPANNQGWRVNAHEFFEDGLIYSDSLVRVEAFHVPHGSWPNAFGFRFTVQGKVIVISGDTAPCDNILKYAQDVDLLIHEVYSKKGFDTKNEFWKNYHKQNHTSAPELGKIANQCQVKKLVLYHLLPWGSSDQEMLNEIASYYNGEVIVGKDLMVIEL